MSKQSGYGSLAAFYDRLMLDANYEKRSDYYLSLFERHGIDNPATLLDLACGTGNLSIPLLKRGVDVIGVDGSQPMLAVAADKLAEESLSMLLICQDMRELDLYGTVNGAVCALDSLNHLCRTADIAAVFARLSLFIEPGGLFVFDMNTPYKHTEILADNVFVFEEDDFLCIWRNQLHERSCTVDMQLDFFAQQDGLYARYTDLVRERAYSERTLRRLLAQSGFDTLAVYEDMTIEPLHPQSERMVFVAKRRFHP